jgi:hypothetical protein
MPNYRALTNHLSGRDEPVIAMSLSELDRIVGGLPPSAHKHGAWWGNSRRSHDHAKYWLDAHRQAKPDFNAGLVRFVVGGEVTRGPNRPRR